MLFLSGAKAKTTLLVRRGCFASVVPLPQDFLPVIDSKVKSVFVFYGIMTLGTLDFQTHPIGRLLLTFVLITNTST